MGQLCGDIFLTLVFAQNGNTEPYLLKSFTKIVKASSGG